MKRIATYCFLSAINNSNHSKVNLDHIFFPIIDNAICSLNKENISSGNLIDLHKKIYDNFDLDLPPTLIKKFIESKQYLDEDFKTNFTLYIDGAFKFDKYHFIDYSDKIDESKSDVEGFYKEYNNYIVNNKINIKIEPEKKLTSFLSHNHIIVSKFFTEKKQLIAPVSDFLTQVEFLNSISKNQKLFNIAKKIYFGSIISSYLEFDFSNIFNNEVEFVLDTNFVLSLLDFNSESKTDTANRIVKTANKIGIKLIILDQHFEETKNLLKRKADELSNFRKLHNIRTDDFFSSCERRNLDKTEVQRIANNLTKWLAKNNIIVFSDYITGFLDKVKGSEIYEKQKNRKHNRKGAFPDSVAIEYVKDKRDLATSDFSESKAWFVCYPLEDRYPQNRPEDGYLYETIFAETLLNILWLTNPSINGENLDKLGLQRLMSETIDASLPSRGILLEIEEKMQLIVDNEDLGISERDCYNVSSVVAQGTIRRQISLLNELNMLKNNDINFAAKIKEISEIEAKEKELLKRNNFNLKTEIIKTKSKLVDKEEESKTDKLIRIRKIEKEIENIEPGIDLKKIKLTERENAYNEIKKKAGNRLRNVLTFFAISYLSLIMILFINYGYKTIIPYYSFSLIVILSIYNAFKLEKFDYNSFVEQQKNINISVIIENSHFDFEIIEELKKDIKSLEDKNDYLTQQIEELDQSLKQE